MKITLNDSVPSARRGAVEAVVRQLAPAAEVAWQSSRFPRIVVMVAPGAGPLAKTARGDFLEGEDGGPGLISTPRLTDQLETAIAAVLGRDPV
jgi:hypothetical protein